MNHPETIIRTLDRYLHRPTKLILYGRAALALGFPENEPFSQTLDVDAILPAVEMPAIEQDEQFWRALEQCNAELEPGGLFMTHLFTDEQLILTPDWLDHITTLPVSGLRRLQLFRPTEGDLILTKMMRVDPQDRADIRFLITKMTDQQSLVSHYIPQARVPLIPEIQHAFEINRAWLNLCLQDRSAGL